MKKSIISVLMIGALLTASLMFTGCGKKSVKVGFINLSEEAQATIESCLYDGFKNKFVFEKIPAVNEASVKKISKKYDLIFAENGESVENLKSVAADFPEELKSSYPPAIIKNETKALPLLLNHYGLAYSTAIKSKTGARYPYSFAELEKYLKKISTKVKNPLFVAGGDDKTLLAFLSAICESYAGVEGYKKFVEALAACSTKPSGFSIEEFLAFPVSETESIASALKVVKDLRKNKYLPVEWEKATLTDMNILCEDNLIGVVFMSLEQYHNMKYSVARNFACDRFPVKQRDVSHGIICPSIVCLNLSPKSDVCAEIQTYLVNSDTQKKLSRGTSLAPAEQSAQAYDKQADDVRFLAAACSGGPVPSAATVLFETDSDKMHQICEALRVYLK